MTIRTMFDKTVNFDIKKNKKQKKNKHQLFQIVELSQTITDLMACGIEMVIFTQMVNGIEENTIFFLRVNKEDLLKNYSSFGSSYCKKTLDEIQEVSKLTYTSEEMLTTIDTKFERCSAEFLHTFIALQDSLETSNELSIVEEQEDSNSKSAKKRKKISVRVPV